MIPDFKTYINETIWSDMEDRSIGDEIRKEDDVNLMDPHTLYEYILDKYKTKHGLPSLRNNEKEISLPLLEINPSSCFLIGYDFNECISISHSIYDNFHDFYVKLNNAFSLQPGGIGIVCLCPKNGGDVNNKFFLDVLDFIIDNANTPKLLISRK